MKDLEYPRFMCRPGTAWELETGRFDVRTVQTAEEAEAAHADGWRGSQYDFGEEAEESPPTREELEAKARALGLAWHHKTGDKKLAEMIAAKESA